MQKLICIPLEQYKLMLESYDEAIEQLEEMKRILASKGKEAQDDEE